MSLWCWLLLGVGISTALSPNSLLPPSPLPLPWEPATVSFATPVLVGFSNFSTPGGSRFWFPGISIPTGLPGHVAQHITLADDGGSCNTPTHPQACEQIMLTQDGGRTYTVTKTLSHGTSGNFNGYGDLGTAVPSPPARVGKVAPPGHFDTIVGCNDCIGGALQAPAFLQTWADGDDGNLTVVRNVSVRFVDSPATFDKGENCPITDNGPARACGFETPSQTIIRTADGTLLLAAYGYASDSKRLCRDGKAAPRLCYTTAFYRSGDGGITWRYASRLDQTPRMPSAVQGPCEPTLALLADGRVLVVFRLDSGIVLWKAYSPDGGLTWGEPTALVGSPGVPFAVYPQLLMLSNGVLVLASGRPGIGFWVSAPTADGANWTGYDVEAEHSRLLPSDPYVLAGCVRACVHIAFLYVLVCRRAAASCRVGV